MVNENSQFGKMYKENLELEKTSKTKGDTFLKAHYRQMCSKIIMLWGRLQAKAILGYFVAWSVT